jgi:endonuclease/exonuclease/phosphatase family metal-dependent hydrolase
VKTIPLSAALRSALARGICTALLVSAAGVAIGVGSSIAPAHASELVAPDPTLVQISVTEAYATWAAVPGADTYTLELWLDGTSVYSHTSPGLSHVLTLPASVPGTTYQYTVAAAGPDAAGESQELATSVSVPRTLTIRPDRTTMRFASYNVCAEHCPRLHSWAYRVSRVVATIRSRAPDVVTLQETGGGARLSSLTSRMRTAGYARATGGHARWTFYRSATMSRLDHKADALYGRTVVVRYGTTGKIQYVPIQLLRQRATNARVLVVNYHLQAFDGSTKDRARVSEFKQVSSNIAAFMAANPAIPVVRSGDFNSLLHTNTSRDSDSARWRVYAQAKLDGFKDARATAVTASHRTASSINQVPSDHRRFPSAFQLDHFFVQRNASVTAFGLLTRDVGYSSQYSDHDMIWADVVLPSR